MSEADEERPMRKQTRGSDAANRRSEAANRTSDAANRTSEAANRMRRTEAAADVVDVAAASVVERLAVLLEAGIPPLAAWGHLDGAVAASVRGAPTASEVPELLRAATARSPDATGWACLAAVWSVAIRVGAPLAPTLTRLADVLHELDEGAREVDAALAGPVATGRLVLALPPLGLALGVLLGVDLAAVFTGIPGLACIAVGTTLLLAGRRWTRRLIDAARDLDPTPGLDAELLAVAVSGGLPIDRARVVVADALRAAELVAGALRPGDSGAADASADRAGAADASADRARSSPPRHPGARNSPTVSPTRAGTPDVDATLEFAARAGVAVAGLLRSTAREARRTARAGARRRAAELGTRLLLPLGVCILPAFVALGVAPLLLGMLASTVVGS